MGIYEIICVIVGIATFLGGLFTIAVQTKDLNNEPVIICIYVFLAILVSLLAAVAWAVILPAAALGGGSYAAIRWMQGRMS